MEKPNELIINKLSEGIYSILSAESIDSGVIDQIDVDRSKNRPPDTRKLMGRVVEDLPWPIGIELQKLFTIECKEYDDVRLMQLFQFVETTTAFFSYILLAQLWNESKNTSLKFNADFNEQFGNFNTKPPAFGIYAGLVRSVHSVFDDNGILPFTEHEKKCGFIRKKFQPVLDQIVVLRNLKVHEKMKVSCVEVEQLVAEFLKHLAFFSMFRLVSVRSIYVYKPRLVSARFRHVLQFLTSNEVAIADTDPAYNSYTASPSVLLVKKFAGEEPDFLTANLNLSPFIVDTKSQMKGMIAPDSIREGVYLFQKLINGKPYYTHIDKNGGTVALDSIPSLEQLDEEFIDLKTSLLP